MILNMQSNLKDAYNSKEKNERKYQKFMMYHIGTCPLNVFAHSKYYKFLKNMSVILNDINYFRCN